MTITPDSAFNSDGSLGATDVLGDAMPAGPTAVPQGRPAANQPAANPIVVVLNPWRYDGNVSFYGPGFYGKRTACGLAYTTTIMGVAHRSLPCGTLVTFKNPANGRTITVPVIDRGPYVTGRQWDLSGAACTALAHCYTGGLYWKYG
jgi:rare lipoprotein A (peptidoglycan hydrolase)